MLTDNSSKFAFQSTKTLHFHPALVKQTTVIDNWRMRNFKEHNKLKLSLQTTIKTKTQIWTAKSSQDNCT